MFYSSRAKWRRRCAPRQRRLLLEQCEGRALLAGSPSGSDSTIDVLEDIPYVLKVADFGFSDPADTPPNAFVGVKLTTAPQSGALLVGENLIAPGDFVSVATITAGSLRFLPFPSAHGTGYASLGFQVVDDGDAAGGTNVDPTPNSLSFNVLPVNDPPTGKDASAFTNLRDLNGLLTFRPSDFAFTDLGDAPRNGFLAVKVAALPAAGSLTNRGSPVAVGDLVLAADIAGGQFRYLPHVPPQTFSISASFKFQVQDDGGTAHGGADLDPVIRTMAISGFYCDCGPPVALPSVNVTIREDEFYTFKRSDFDFTSPFDGQSVEGISILSNPIPGLLILYGTPISTGFNLTGILLDTGALRYLPSSNHNGNPAGVFSFQVNDRGAPEAYTRNFGFNVLAINDAPQGSNGAITTLEDREYIFNQTDFGFTDWTDAPANGLQSIRIVMPPTVGALTAGGVPVRAGDVVLAYDIAAGKLRFKPPANRSGMSQGSLTFRVTDDGGTADGGRDTSFSQYDLTINLSAVNDPPSGGDSTITLLEDATHRLAATDFRFSDAQDQPANQLAAVVVTKLPERGSLKLGESAVVLGQRVAAAEIANLSYVPLLNDNGPARATIGFQVQDDGGTASGGSDLDPSPNTITFDITLVNDPPSGTDKRLVRPSCFGLSYFGVEDFGFTDSADSPSDSFIAVRIESLPSVGQLRLNGTPVVPGQVISVIDLASGRLSFTSPRTFETVSIEFHVQDDGGTALGGIDFDQTRNAITLDLIPIGAPPAIVTTRRNALEDVPYVFQSADFLPQMDDGRQLVSVQILTLPPIGFLSLAGTPVSREQVIPIAEVAAVKLSYVSPLNVSGAIFMFDILVRDDESICDELNPPPSFFSLTLVPVNDAPSFVKSKNVTSLDISGPVRVPGWAIQMSKGAPNESGQTLQFEIVGNTNPELFSVAPSVDALGDLSFTPRPNAQGTAEITIVLKDNGGTANGGVDRSGEQKFAIEITKPFPWTNSLNELDVTADGIVTAKDALTVMNHLNAFGVWVVEPDANVGPPYYDVIWDNRITAGDVLKVINHINSGGRASGESVAGTELVEGEVDSPAGDWLAILALDVAGLDVAGLGVSGHPRRRG